MYTKFKNTKKNIKTKKIQKKSNTAADQRKLYTVAKLIKKAENQEVSEQSKDEAQSNDKPLTLGAR